jgi:hypothetical protein
MSVRETARRSDMFKGHRVILSFLALVMVLSVVGLAACSGGEDGTTTGATNTPIAEMKANVTGNLVAVRVSKGVYPWELDIKLAEAGDVIGYANPLKGKSGEVITAKTLKYMLGFTIGQGVSAVITQETGKDGTYLVATDING